MLNVPASNLNCDGDYLRYIVVYRFCHEDAGLMLQSESYLLHSVCFQILCQSNNSMLYSWSCLKNILGLWLLANVESCSSHNLIGIRGLLQ
jgi:hypothetical protein